MAARKSTTKKASPTKKAPAKKAPAKKAAAKKAPAKRAPAKKAAASKAASKKAPAKKATAKKATPKKASSSTKPKSPEGKPAKAAAKGISSTQVNMGTVFSLRPRVSTTFRQDDFVSAKRLLEEESYPNIQEAARAVAERALSMSNDPKSRPGVKRGR